MTPCDCKWCPDGAPQQWQVTISGITNHTCTQCASINGVYTLSRAADFGGSCVWGGPAMPCSFTGFQLTIYQDTVTGNVDIKLVAIGAPPTPTWTQSNISSCSDSSYTLTGGGQGNTTCNWPTSVTVTPIVPAITDTSLNGCLPCLQGGCPEGAGNPCLSPLRKCLSL